MSHRHRLVDHIASGLRSTVRVRAIIQHEMKPRTFPALFALSALLITPAARADDLKAMEGTWKLESAETRGQKEESDDAKDIVLKITGERYEIRIKDKIDGGTLKLDETKKPKTLDATDTEGDDVGKVVKAIYELSGDTLRVCHAGDDGERPTEMATKEDSPVIIMTFKREKKTE